MKHDVFCCGKCRTLQDMLSAHGTLGEFSRAVFRAIDDLMVTPDEGLAAIDKYRRDILIARDVCGEP